MKFIKDIKIEIKNLNGNVLAIGICEEISKLMSKNKKISNFFFIEELKGKRNYSKKTWNEKSKLKTFNVKKLYKKFKNKNIDYIIYDYNEVQKYIRFIVPGTVKLCKKDIIIYGKIDEYKINSLVKKYNRYNTAVTITKIGEEFYLKINVITTKTFFFKNLIYRVVDFWENILDLIGDGLMN